MKTQVEFPHCLGNGMWRSLDFFDFGNAATLHLRGSVTLCPRLSTGLPLSMTWRMILWSPSKKFEHKKSRSVGRIR